MSEDLNKKVENENEGEESEAYIYISKTKKSIVAKIKFGEPIIADANTIALIAEQEEPGSYNGMMEYLYNNIGYAIPVEEIIPIEEVSLSQLQEKQGFPLSRHKGEAALRCTYQVVNYVRVFQKK